MIKKIILFLITGLSMALAGCASTPTPITSDSLIPNAASTIPYDVESTGLFRVSVRLNEQGPFVFIIDTGASVSILFEKTARQLDIPINTGETTNIHGITQSSQKPVTRLQKIQIGDIVRENLRVAILEDREGEIPPDGILGMDILSQYSWVFDADTSQLIAFSPANFNADAFNVWREIALSTNPYTDVGSEIFFLQLKLSGYSTPAILDLGSSFSIANWAATKNPELRRYRKRLRENWKMQGAVGTFEPSVFVKFENVRNVAYNWEDWRVFITDMDTLNIVGLEDVALMIAGADMFRDTSFALDFANSKLFLKPSRAHKKARKDPMTGTRTKANTGAIGVFDGIDR